MRVLFSIFIWLLAFLWMAVLSITTALLLPIVPYRKSHSYVAAPGFALIIKAITLGHFRIVYDAAFDRTRQSVFCMNHTSILDAFAASAAIPHAFCGVMNAWQFYIPFYGWLMGLSKGIAVHQKKPKEMLEEITEGARDRLGKGFSILVFPEAHRTLDGHVRTFRKGVFYMARDIGAPVVPLACRGMFDVNRKGSFGFHPGKIEVYVGPQMETKGLTDDQIAGLAKDTHEIVSSWVEFGDIHAPNHPRTEVVSA